MKLSKKTLEISKNKIKNIEFSKILTKIIVTFKKHKNIKKLNTKTLRKHWKFQKIFQENVKNPFFSLKLINLSKFLIKKA